MKPERIVELIKQKDKELKDNGHESGVTQSSIADELGLRQPAVNQVIHKRQTSRRIQDKICEVIGYPFEEVFGKG
ncbi:hypothetical protein KAR91_46635 [Candidatus Pacearchaeota archaeon]|nr:hypothetical protein [Candidatus Pacearchaeota archaeon]